VLRPPNRRPQEVLIRQSWKRRTEKGRSWKDSKKIEKSRRREPEEFADKKRSERDKTKSREEKSCRKKLTVASIRKLSKEGPVLFRLT